MPEFLFWSWSILQDLQSNFMENIKNYLDIQ